MSIIILGGCGEIGRFIAVDLIKSGFDVTIADLREIEGERLAKRLGKRASFQRLYIRHFDTLVEVLKNYKLVINNIGPYFEFGDWVPRATLQAGINYADICDDHDVTLTLLNMNKRVEREGLTYLINFGASPGLTNIMAKMGAEKLDKVSSVRVLWFEDTGETIGLGQMMHWAHIAMGKIPIYRDGEWLKVKALSEREVVKFPDPCGLIPLYFVGHPEPVTIPRFIKTNEAVCKGGILPESNVQLTRTMDKLIPIKNIIIMKMVCKFFLKILPLLTGEIEKREIISAFSSEIIGQKQQKDIRLSYATVGAVAKLTSAPASIASQMIVEKEISTPGVFPPEGCPDLNITKMIKELEKRGIYIIENAIHHY
ncbi:MAG: saccharopine dehydrogenase NADP-binding domain-containing protein [Candidatus Lokiarchaeota archaeon]|nr:saccharopine dehydrogenase NADP-binding domain-containing protein [Candidatus Lokiarchaeota archaeon]